MPITQSRMIALINAADDFETALDNAEQMVLRQLSYAEAGTMSWENAMRSAAQLVNRRALLAREAETVSTLAVERAHFKRNKRRNEAAARWQAAHRHTTGSRKQRQNMAGPYYLDQLSEPTTAPSASATAPRRIAGSPESEVTRLLALQERLDAEEAAGAQLQAPDPNGGDSEGPDLSIMEGFKGNGDGLTAERRAEIEREMDALDKLGLMDTPTDGDEPGEGNGEGEK